jgi:hypothetical protein
MSSTRRRRSPSARPHRSAILVSRHTPGKEICRSDKEETLTQHHERPGNKLGYPQVPDRQGDCQSRRARREAAARRAVSGVIVESLASEGTV